MVRTTRQLWIGSWLALLSAVAQAATPVPPTEHEVKAAFLYNFAKYVEWPEASAGDAFVVGILGDDPFGKVLDQTLSGKEIRGQKLAVRRYESTDEARHARILFIGASERRDLARVLRELAPFPVLTVGEMDGFAARGGMVGFRLEGDIVRFDINAEEVTRAQLKMSSQLLKLARIVRTGGES
jgi:hypothetical protein